MAKSFKRSFPALDSQDAGNIASGLDAFVKSFMAARNAERDYQMREKQMNLDEELRRQNADLYKRQIEQSERKYSAGEAMKFGRAINPETGQYEDIPGFGQEQDYRSRVLSLREQEAARKAQEQKSPLKKSTAYEKFEMARGTALGKWADDRENFYLNIKRLKSAQKQLESGRDDLTGPAIGNIPTEIRGVTNQESVKLQNDMEQIIQQDLRRILGAQFGEKEGQQFLKRGFDPTLEEKLNARGVKDMIGVLEAVGQAKDAELRHLKKYGNLDTYEGPRSGQTFEQLTGIKLNGDKPKPDAKKASATYQRLLKQNPQKAELFKKKLKKDHNIDVE